MFFWGSMNLLLKVAIRLAPHDPTGLAVAYLKWALGCSVKHLIEEKNFTRADFAKMGVDVVQDGEYAYITIPGRKA